MTKTFVNPRTGQEEAVEYIVNATGAIHSVSLDHPALKVINGGGDRGERETYKYFRLATNAEVLRYVRRVERVD